MVLLGFFQLQDTKTHLNQFKQKWGIYLACKLQKVGRGGGEPVSGMED